MKMRNLITGILTLATLYGGNLVYHTLAANRDSTKLSQILEDIASYDKIIAERGRFFERHPEQLSPVSYQDMALSSEIQSRLYARAETLRDKIKMHKEKRFTVL